MTDATKDALDWPPEGRFAVQDPDPADDHGPIYLVFPDGLMVNCSNHLAPGMDAKRLAWMADVLNAALLPVADVGLVEEAERFHIDHGMIHDRVTGRHVTTAPDDEEWNGGTITSTCALLNELAALRSSRPSPQVPPLGEGVWKTTTIRSGHPDLVQWRAWSKDRGELGMFDTEPEAVAALRSPLALKIADPHPRKIDDEDHVRWLFSKMLHTLNATKPGERVGWVGDLSALLAECAFALRSREARVKP